MGLTLESIEKSGGDRAEPVENIPREIHDLLCFLQKKRRKNEEHFTRGYTMHGHLGRGVKPRPPVIHGHSRSYTQHARGAFSKFLTLSNTGVTHGLTDEPTDGLNVNPSMAGMETTLDQLW